MPNAFPPKGNAFVYPLIYSTFAVLFKGGGKNIHGCSSIGRAAVSKTAGWEFESLHPCHTSIFPMNRVAAFVKDSFKEVQTKVSWPSFTELQSSTILVLVASLIFALVIGLVDMGFENALRLFYQSFSR